METDCGFRNPKILPQEMYFRVAAYNVLISGDPIGEYILQKTVSRLWGAWRTTPVQDYFWAVVCKNHRFHHKGNIGYEHHILLGETDAYASLPMLPEKIQVRCDRCGEEYSYKSKEVLRDEIEVPEHFVPPPLFKDAAGLLNS